MAIAAVTTALFWGIYGPLLTWGHNAMVVEVDGEDISYGRLRPFICVGIAYLIVAIIGPALLISFGVMEPGEGLLSGWSFGGIGWSLVAGGAGALGALFLLVALNFAPKQSPALYVMPLVFGCAPVVNTLFSIYMRRAWGDINPFFAAGLILVGVGSVTVLIAAPAPKKKPPTPAVSEEGKSLKKPIEEKIKEEVTEEKAEAEKP